jgi:hypothetical protein
MSQEKEFSLYTWETIRYKDNIKFSQEVLGTTIFWDCITVDKNNLIKALKSIKYNGMVGSYVKTDEDYIGLIVDYCEVKSTKTANYILLSFDEHEEQEISLVYELTDLEYEKYLKDEHVVDIILN